MVEEVRDDHVDGGDGILALIVRAASRAEGTQPLTDRRAPMQLLAMGWPLGKVVAPHKHCPCSPRTVYTTSEFLLVKSGAVRVRVYNTRNEVVREVVVRSGDCILLLGGGHSVEALTDSQLLEVKQGPFLDDKKELRWKLTKPWSES